jgi:transposase-like protein
MGAPRKHPPEEAAVTIERLASQGHAIIGIAKQLGIGRETFKRWCEEDESLQEAFDVGRETERHYLHSLVVQVAVLNKGANANAMFLLNARHGYRENDSTNTNVNVGFAVVPNVMVVRDHGTNEEWSARSAEQRRALVLDAANTPKAIEAQAAVEPTHIPAIEATQAHAHIPIHPRGAVTPKATPD